MLPPWHQPLHGLMLRRPHVRVSLIFSHLESSFCATAATDLLGRAAIQLLALLGSCCPLLRVTDQASSAPRWAEDHCCLHALACAPRYLLRPSRSSRLLFGGYCEGLHFNIDFCSHHSSCVLDVFGAIFAHHWPKHRTVCS